jgi:putative ABC transport system permease protein
MCQGKKRNLPKIPIETFRSLERPSGGISRPIRLLGQLLEQRIANSTSRTKFVAVLALVLVLAVTGVYGLIAYSVAQRTREIGIRMALGARSSQVLCQALCQGMRLVVLGGVIGVAAALALTRLVRSLLYEVSATDPLTFASVALLLTAAALLACYVPARRASRIDPMAALRCE